jgi:hypothetical protein
MSTPQEQGMLDKRESLSAQQMQALQKQYAEGIMAIRKDLELRKLALDQACNLVSTTKGTVDPIDLARKLHSFLIEGAVTPDSRNVST